jgi:hypothetical protein
MSLFGNKNGPVGNTGSLFSQGGITTNPSLFSAITGSSGLFGQGNLGTGLFNNAGTGGSNPAASNPGGLFGQGASNTGGLFGQGPNNSGSLFNQPSSGGGLFAKQTSNTGLFGQPSGPNSLFNQVSNTSSLFAQPSSNTGGLFAQPSSNTGGLFGQPSSSTGGLFGQPSSNTGGLFGQPSSTGGLFGQPSSTGGLFAQSSSGTFGTFNPTSNSMFSGYPSSTPQPASYSPDSNSMSKTIGTLSEQEKNFFFLLKSKIDENDTNLNQSESIIKSIEKFKKSLKEKLFELFTYSRKVQTLEKRCKTSTEILKKFEVNINNYIKDAVSVYTQCEFADSFHPIGSPGVFLSDMLDQCDGRLKLIEDNFKEIQELLLVESQDYQINMLVNTIGLMQEKFQLVTSLAFDVHKRVTEVLAIHSNKPGLSDFKNSPDKESSPKKNIQTKNYSSIKDIISGKSVYSGYYN